MASMFAIASARWSPRAKALGSLNVASELRAAGVGVAGAAAGAGVAAAGTAGGTGVDEAAGAGGAGAADEEEAAALGSALGYEFVSRLPLIYLSFIYL